MSHGTVYLDVESGRCLPLWAEHRIRTRAQAEADYLAREVGVDVALVVHAGMDAGGRIFAGIADRRFEVRMHGLVPMRSPSAPNCGDISP